MYIWERSKGTAGKAVFFYHAVLVTGMLKTH